MNYVNYWEIGGALLTTFAAIMTYIKSGDSPKWNLVLTVILLGLIFSFLISIRYEILPRIEKSQDLAYKLAENENASEILKAIIDVRASAFYAQNGVFKDKLDEELVNFQQLLTRANNGQLIVEKEDIPLFSDKLINTASKSIKATSYVKGTEWWLSRWGREYEEINYHLVRDGISITRFFIFSNLEEYKEMKEIIKRHVKYNIETYVLFNWKSSYVHTEDIILVDKKTSGLLVLDPEKNMKNAIISVNPSSIRDVENRFRRIRKASTPADEMLLEK